MRAKDIKKDSITITELLKNKIIEIGNEKAAEITGLKKTDFSAWVHGRRNWSVSKILDVAEKLGL